MNIECSFCHALHWKAEALTSSTINNQKFGMCCYQGKISLPKLHKIPRHLRGLFIADDHVSRDFHKNILFYNNCLAMTSTGKTTDPTVNQGGRGPYSYVLRGELIHQAGSVLPPEGREPIYSQLYIHDTEQATDLRLRQHHLNGRNRDHPLNPYVLNLLQGILHQSHPAVHLYEQALAHTRNMALEQQFAVSLHFDSTCDRRRYNLPNATVNEIAAVIIGDGEQITGSQDIIVYRKGRPLELFRISDSHPLYSSLRYVLLFPTGQLGWYPTIPYNETENQAAPRRREYVSLEQYFRYQFHIRPFHIESDHLFLAGKLFQAYVCESWAIAEQKRLGQLAAIQNNLRVELYQGLADAIVANVDVNLNDLGRRTILPSSFSGGTRYMQQLCQDALAINRYFGGGDLFITMTANSAWPEIKDALLYNQAPHTRPDLISRVFHAKLHSLIKDIKGGMLGDILGFLYTIEFQKRGLPHAHIIVFLKPHAKLRTPQQVDSLMSSEFPVDNPELLELIKKFMVHNPCGDQNRQSPCMENGVCTKGFPKPFNERTSITEDSYARMRRLNTGQTFRIGQGDRTYHVDNRWVVCHSKYLIWKYRCHINVESIASVKAVKYIYKYVYKGHDRTTMQFGTAHDEIRHYLDARYVSSCEATWRLYFFEVQNHEPSVLRLAVHLPQQQSVVLNPDRDTLQEALARHENRLTTLTGWFKANADHQDGVINNTLYQDFPNKMVWHKDTHVWTVRQRGFQIGRMYYAHPSAGERFYLRLLLTVVKGATSYEALRTVQGVLHPTFREACIAQGLTEDDNEWHQCLEEAKHMAVGRQMRHLFVTIIKDCDPADPRALWDTFWQDICDDLKRHPVFRNREVEPSEEEIQDYGLYLIDQILIQAGKSLQNWDSLPQVVGNWGTLLQNLNPFIAEQRDYDILEQADLAAQHIATLNPDQRSAFDRITAAVVNSTGDIFFLHGPGGTGKTYVYNTLCYDMRSNVRIVLCVASSGIAAILLKGGRTVHLRFKVPIPINESSFCNIPKTSQLADLIRRADLVIWDEAPMQHKHIMEAVDRSFRDLRDDLRPFGGLTVVFGGDFQQILPVILKGSRAQVVGACMQRSYLWSHIIVLRLHQNMRLNTNVQEEANFAKWQLEVGHGQHTDDSCNITLPNHFHCPENTVDSLLDIIYPDLHVPGHSDQYFSERIILSCINKKVNELNETVLARFPGPSQIFHSVDSIPNSEQLGEHDPLLNYPVEYLNEVNCGSLPLAKLELKIGCPVMVLKNLDAANGVCNGSRGILTRYGNRVLEVRLLTGSHAGQTVFIPRVANLPGEDENAFKFTRRQFPIRVCFSMTINKSQGQSVKFVGLDLRSPAFTHGQFYVAVSRVTSVSNIKAIWDEEDREGKSQNVVYSEVLLE
jgi:PIF1-like helicase/Helitron helicase-like domain at N-terminus